MRVSVAAPKTVRSIVDSQAVKNTCNANISSKLLDRRYHLEHRTIEFKKISSQIMTKIKFELSKKLAETRNPTQEKLEFVPVRARWVIERSNASMESCKTLVKNFDRTLGNGTAKLNLCLIGLMLN